MEFDWVTARSACSITSLFESLALQVEEDVKKRQGIEQETASLPPEFKFKREANAFFVSRTSVFTGVTAVIFVLDGDFIEVRERGGSVKSRASATLNNLGECRLKIDDQEYELWQFRKLALEDLFFQNVKQ